MNGSFSEDSLLNSSRSVFPCPGAAQIHVSKGEVSISLYLAFIVGAISCPNTILLNILVIVTVLKTRELRTNSNILLTSLAATDLLVGLVPAPLAIVTDALHHRRTVSFRVTCTMRKIYLFAMLVTFIASYNHLILMAWERYVAVVRCLEYKFIVTKGRIKRDVVIAWITAITATAFYIVFDAAGVQLEVILVTDIIICVLWLIGFLLVVYFYFMVYKQIRKQHRSQFRRVDALIKARIESRLAFTAFLLTFVVFASFVPLIVSLFANLSLIVKQTWRWTQIFVQVNSLVNPALYFYRNRRCRKAAVKLLKFKKPQKTQPVRQTKLLAKRHWYSIVSLDIKDFVNTEIAKRSPARAQSWAAEAFERWISVRGEQDKAVEDRSISCPTLINHGNLFEVTRLVTRTIIVQIECAREKKPSKRRTNLSNDRYNAKTCNHRGMPRSESLNENALVVLKSGRPKLAEVKHHRRKSAPLVLRTESNILRKEELQH